MTQTLGNYGDVNSNCEYLTLAFSPSSAPVRARWRNNGLSADFLGDYVTTFLPKEGNPPEPQGGQDEMKHAVTYIANELLENAMKYHERAVDVPIGIHLQLTGEYISVSASNGAGMGQAEKYKAFIDELQSKDVSDLLIEKLEQGATSDEQNVSSMGLLTMISDYGAELGWRFENHPALPDVMIVTTRAILPIA